MFSAGILGAFSFRMRALVLAGLATTSTCKKQKGLDFWECLNINHFLDLCMRWLESDLAPHECWFCAVPANPPYLTKAYTLHTMVLFVCFQCLSGLAKPTPA